MSHMSMQMSVCHIIKTRNPYEPASPCDCGAYYLRAQSCLKRTREDVAWTFNFLSSRMRDSIERLMIAYVEGTEIPLVEDEPHCAPYTI